MRSDVLRNGVVPWYWSAVYCVLFFCAGALVGARDVADAITDGAAVEATKPAPVYSPTVTDMVLHDWANRAIWAHPYRREGGP
jgi:hypothetical protein